MDSVGSDRLGRGSNHIIHIGRTSEGRSVTGQQGRSVTGPHDSRLRRCRDAENPRRQRRIRGGGVRRKISARPRGVPKELLHQSPGLPIVLQQQVRRVDLRLLQMRRHVRGEEGEERRRELRDAGERRVHGPRLVGAIPVHDVVAFTAVRQALFSFRRPDPFAHHEAVPARYSAGIFRGGGPQPRRGVPRGYSVEAGRRRGSASDRPAAVGRERGPRSTLTAHAKRDGWL